MLVLKDHEGGQMVRRNFKPEQIINFGLSLLIEHIVASEFEGRSISKIRHTLFFVRKAGVTKPPWYPLWGQVSCDFQELNISIFKVSLHSVFVAVSLQDTCASLCPG
jgi:hypothetical protein